MDLFGCEILRNCHASNIGKMIGGAKLPTPRVNNIKIKDSIVTYSYIYYHFWDG